MTCIAAAALAVTTAGLLALAPGAAGEGIVLDGSEVTAERADDGSVSATVRLINTGTAAVSLTRVVTVSPGCAARLAADATSVPPLQTAERTLSLDPACFPEGTAAVDVDLDGIGPVPAVTVKAPTAASGGLGSLWGGLVAGVLAGAWVLLWGRSRVRGLVRRLDELGSAPGRRDSHRRLTLALRARFADLGVVATTSPEPPALDYGWGSVVGSLEAGWSFKDSWLTTLTGFIATFTALFSSTDLFTAVLGQDGKAELRVPAVAALVGALLVAAAVFAVRAAGPSSAEVTVFGLVLGTALVVASLVLQIIVYGMSAAGLLGTSTVAGQSVQLAAVALAALVLWYGCRSLRQALEGGVPETMPALPEDVLTAWPATEPWQRIVLVDALRHDYRAVLDLLVEDRPRVVAADTGGLDAELLPGPAPARLDEDLLTVPAGRPPVADGGWAGARRAALP